MIRQSTTTTAAWPVLPSERHCPHRRPRQLGSRVICKLCAQASALAQVFSWFQDCGTDSAYAALSAHTSQQSSLSQRKRNPLRLQKCCLRPKLSTPHGASANRCNSVCAFLPAVARRRHQWRRSARIDSSWGFAVTARQTIKIRRKKNKTKRKAQSRLVATSSVRGAAP